MTIGRKYRLQYLEHAIQLAPGSTEIDDRLVMQLHIALTNSEFHTLGPVREVGAALDEALSIAERRDDTCSQLRLVKVKTALA